MVNEKKCFIIMPISDQDGYEKGHFSRVYRHIIKPACDRAGFNPIRADDEIKTNYIVIDIIKKIIEADIVICDLSSKNPNVLYELGLRQAFNKKSVLIKDKKTNRIFDIQGLRTIEYDENLRIDEVEDIISNLAKSLKETFQSDSSEVNSLIQLLSLKPASIPNNVELSKESSLILDAISDLSRRILNMEKNQNNEPQNSIQQIKKNVKFLVNGFEAEIGYTVSDGRKYLGDLVDIYPDSIIVSKDNINFKINKSEDLYSRLEIYPF